MSKRTFHIQTPLDYLFQIGLTTLTHMLNGYEVCFNTTNYLIFNMQYFRYWLSTSILYYFCQLISPQCVMHLNPLIIFHFCLLLVLCNISCLFQLLSSIPSYRSYIKCHEYQYQELIIISSMMHRNQSLNIYDIEFLMTIFIIQLCYVALILLWDPRRPNSGQ